MGTSEGRAEDAAPVGSRTSSMVSSRMSHPLWPTPARFSTRTPGLSPGPHSTAASKQHPFLEVHCTMSTMCGVAKPMHRSCRCAASLRKCALTGERTPVTLRWASNPRWPAWEGDRTWPLARERIVLRLQFSLLVGIVVVRPVVVRRERRRPLPLALRRAHSLLRCLSEWKVQRSMSELGVQDVPPPIE